MATAAFISTFQPLLDDNGDPLASGTVEFRAPGLTELKTVYSTPFLDTALTNPVTLDSAGRAEVWMSGDCDIVVQDALGNTIYTRDNVNPETAGADSGTNLVSNGSFELNTLADNKTPDSWTLTEETGSTVVLDSDSAAGAKAIKFTSAGSGGGNVITTDFFEVSGGDILTVGWQMKSSVVDVRNLVQMHWYDAAKSLISSSTLYDESAANPTSYTQQLVTTTAPSNARFAKMQMYGAHPSDATPGDTFYDAVEVFPSSLGGAFPSGTKMFFQQATAPTGWTIDATHDDKSIRLVDGGSGVTTGGTLAFSAAFAAGRSTDLTNLVHDHPVGQLDAELTATLTNLNATPGSSGLFALDSNNRNVILTQDTGNNTQSLNHDHDLDVDVNFVDTILAAKD